MGDFLEALTRLLPLFYRELLATPVMLLPLLPCFLSSLGLSAPGPLEELFPIAEDFVTIGVDFFGAVFVEVLDPDIALEKSLLEFYGSSVILPEGPEFNAVLDLLVVLMLVEADPANARLPLLVAGVY